MQESSTLTNHQCAYTPCNCRVAPGEKYCSDYCEDHARHRIAVSSISSGAEGCGCGHAECDSADAAF